MSRNKDIKLLHEATGLSYKSCRRYMKANHWDFTSAYFSATGLDKIPELQRAVANAVVSLNNLLADMFAGLGEAFIQISKNLKGEV